jgi:outer membrane lipoprotein carrier protein
LRVIFQFALRAFLIFLLSPILAESQTASSPAHPSDNAPDTPLLRRFEERYRNPSSLAATFLERYVENGRVLRVEAGQAYFLRPGKMRWEYESPEKNLFLVDGKIAWFYVPADHSVTRVPAKESADWRTPLALLAGRMKLSRICASIQPADGEKPESPENAVFHCELRGEKTNSAEAASQDKAKHTDRSEPSVLFEISKSTAELVRLFVQDAAGGSLDFHFKDSLFHFHVPPGIAIVNGELPAAQNALNP